MGSDFDKPVVSWMNSHTKEIDVDVNDDLTDEISTMSINVDVIDDSLEKHRSLQIAVEEHSDALKLAPLPVAEIDHLLSNRCSVSYSLIMSSIPSCVFCFVSLTKPNERNLVESRGDFQVAREIESLQFVVRTEISRHLCRKCLGLFKKRHSLKEKLKELDRDLLHGYRNHCTQRGIPVKMKNPVKRDWPISGNENFVAVDKACQATSESTLKEKASQTDIFQETQPVIPKKSDEGYETKVFVRAEWCSGAREKQLPSGLCALGKMLVRGTLKQIAHAAWSSTCLKEFILKDLLKSVHHECAAICSRKNPSILRKTKKEQITEFSFDNLEQELAEKTPILNAVLKTASMRKLGEDNTLSWIPSVCMAAAICMKNRSHHMTALQLLVSIILKHGGISASIRRLQAVHVTPSMTYINKKLDDYGENHDADMMKCIELECTRMQKVQDKRKATPGVKAMPTSLELQIDIGRKQVFDNIDFEQKVHHMTEEHQNNLIHWTSYMSTENRVSGCHLQDQEPQCDLQQLENGKFVPDRIEHSNQRRDYIHHASKIATKYIPCLNSLMEVVPKYIKHLHMEETAAATKTTFHGLIYANENTADGISQVLKVLQKYVPFAGDGNERLYSEQGIVGDQLSVERAVNCVLQLSNGFTPEERLTGMHFEAGDFHAGIKFMQIVFDNFYSGKSTTDACTMFNDATLINRRNVGGVVKNRTNASKEFLLLEVRNRVVAAFMQELKLENIDDDLPCDIGKTKDQKRSFLVNLSSKVVDKYILNKDKMEHLLERARLETERRTMTTDGKYMCRHPGCFKVFKHDGKVALMEMGMIIYNFFDAVSMGDGDRVVRSWKFMLLYLKADGPSSTKYSLEGFYLLCQYYSLLSKKGAFNLKWNRFFKSSNGKDGNIPLDLALEHFNGMLKNIFRMLGPNATNNKILDRYCKALVISKALTNRWDMELHLIRKSGKHTKKETHGDLEKVVKQLIEKHALREKPGRELKSYSGQKASLVENMDIHSLFKWIDGHKKLVLFKKVAR
eukprot:gene8410-9308_t